MLFVIVLGMDVLLLIKFDLLVWCFVFVLKDYWIVLIECNIWGFGGLMLVLKLVDVMIDMMLKLLVVC